MQSTGLFAVVRPPFYAISRIYKKIDASSFLTNRGVFHDPDESPELPMCFISLCAVLWWDAQGGRLEPTALEALGGVPACEATLVALLWRSCRGGGSDGV